jgi:hypothetical protein
VYSLTESRLLDSVPFVCLEGRRSEELLTGSRITPDVHPDLSETNHIIKMVVRICRKGQPGRLDVGSEFATDKRERLRCKAVQTNEFNGTIRISIKQEQESSLVPYVEIISAVLPVGPSVRWEFAREQM